MSKYYVCCIARGELKYIREFVEHYLSLGFTKVIIYDNNFGDEERYDNVLKDYIDQDCVEIVDFRDRVQAQNAAYNDCYAKRKNEFDWILFADADEFLILNKHHTIDEFLQDKKDYECVLVNWQTMTDNNLIYYENKPLMERFTEQIPFDKCVQYAKTPENAHVKSLIKGGLPFICFYSNPHCVVNPIKCCNADGKSCNLSPFQNITWETAYLRHFTTKSAEEYCEKLRRGVPDRSYDMFLKTYIGRFWRYNEKTDGKVKVFEKHGFKNV